MLSNKSYFEKEEKRKFDLFKLPLLQLVLEKLPFLASTKAEEDDIWASIAILIQKGFPQEEMNYGGYHMKNEYENMLKEFEDRFPFALAMEEGTIQTGPPRLIVMTLKTEQDRYLHKLNRLKFYNVDVALDIAKENYAAAQREKYNRNKTIVEFEDDISRESKNGGSSGELNKTPSTDPSVLWKKITFLEAQVDEKDDMIKRLLDENKKLQELAQLNLASQK